MSTPAILIVDDEPVVRALLRAALEPAGLLLEAADGTEALELAWQRRPEIVVLDVGLPLLSGIDVCRALKTHLPPPRVLLITGNGYTEGIDTCGADAVVVKPFDHQALLAEVRRLLALPIAA
jgi:two-component system, OmpR family, KDP operon response regulator KdpE